MTINARVGHPARTILAALVASLASLGSGLNFGPSAGAAVPALPPCGGALGHVRDSLAVVTMSASEDSGALNAVREGALEAFALQAAGCHGTLEVVLDPSENATTVAYSGSPGATSAATAIAYARLSTLEVNNSVIPAIDAAIARAERKGVPTEGTPDGVYEILAEDRGSGPLDALVLSNFVEEDPVVNLTRHPNLTVTQAVGLAHLVSVPRLPHAHVEIKGVGRTTSNQTLDVWVGSIRAFAKGTCVATGATCTVTTQVAP